MAKESTKARAKKKPKFSSRIVRRCFICGRKYGYMRKFDVCRIHFRELASEGLLPGINKLTLKFKETVQPSKISKSSGDLRPLAAFFSNILFSKINQEAL